jgi:hypothetical protein
LGVSQPATAPSSGTTPARSAWRRVSRVTGATVPDAASR